MAGYLFSSFLGGVPAGFFLPIGAVLSDGTSILLGGAGATVVIASTAEAADRDAEPPPALLNELRSRTPEYQEAFRSAYADQLRRRRVRASLWGGGVGAGVGLGALVWLVSQFSGDF